MNKYKKVDEQENENWHNSGATDNSWHDNNWRGGKDEKYPNWDPNSEITGATGAAAAGKKGGKKGHGKNSHLLANSGNEETGGADQVQHANPAAYMFDEDEDNDEEEESQNDFENDGGQDGPGGAEENSPGAHQEEEAE